MQVFIRTLIITLILCVGYYIWAFLGKASYNPDLTITKDAKNVVVQEKHKSLEPDNVIAADKNETLELCFLSNEDTIKTVSRKAEHKTLYTAIRLLLKGPTKDESASGIFSEIPSNTRLISIKDENSKIIINLSKEFGEGGGTQSVEARINQLSKTAKLYSSNKPVYLYLDGEQAQYIGGEGIFVDQPLK